MSDDNTSVTPSATPPAQSGEKEQFSREYVKELREENKSWRVKAQEAEKLLETTKSETATKLADSQKAIENATKASQERIIRAELKATALAAGMVDLDFLKLADLSQVTLSDEGEVKGAEDMIEALKKSKPHFFTENKTSSSTAKPPEKKPEGAKSAKDMTPEEYAKERERIVRR